MVQDPSWKMGQRNGRLPTGGVSDKLPDRGRLDDIDDMGSVYEPERRPVDSEYKEK